MNMSNITNKIFKDRKTGTLWQTTDQKCDTSSFYCPICNKDIISSSVVEYYNYGEQCDWNDNMVCPNCVSLIAPHKTNELKIEGEADFEFNWIKVSITDMDWPIVVYIYTPHTILNIF